MIQFNEKFNQRLTALLGDSANEYYRALEQPSVRGLHINTTKCTKDVIDKLGYTENIFEENTNIRRVKTNCKPTLHPYYSAGLFYMQEPSAMLPVTALPQLGECKVLDMCSAPGGKSSQFAIKLAGQGLLVSNEVDRQRAQILRENIVRMGYNNTLILSMNTQDVARQFANYFDVVVVDAPCSGEGMFRKEPQALRDWSEANIKACASRQKQIVDNANTCLKQNGLLLYSTCTFASEEDEEIAQYIVDLGYEIVEAPSYVTQNSIKVKYGYKYLPHLFQGEGQYFCMFRKIADCQQESRFDKKNIAKVASKKNIELLKEIMDINGLNICEHQGLLYTPAFQYNIPCLTNGVLLAKVERDGRLTPTHQLFTVYGNRCCQQVNLTLDDVRIKEYLSGREINCNAKGWCAVNVDGYTLGCGKGSNGVVKNHYPKNLRVL